MLQGVGKYAAMYKINHLYHDHGDCHNRCMVHKPRKRTYLRPCTFHLNRIYSGIVRISLAYLSKTAKIILKQRLQIQVSKIDYTVDLTLREKECRLTSVLWFPASWNLNLSLLTIFCLAFASEAHLAYCRQFLHKSWTFLKKLICRPFSFDLELFCGCHLPVPWLQMKNKPSFSRVQSHLL